MTVRVVGHTLPRVECPGCRAILEFSIEDVRTNDVGHGPPPEYIICPDC